MTVLLRRVKIKLQIEYRFLRLTEQVEHHERTESVGLWQLPTVWAHLAVIG